MTTDDLKVGDRVKFKDEVKGEITSIAHNNNFYIKCHDGEYFAGGETIVSKLEPITNYKEIPIEQKPPIGLKPNHIHNDNRRKEILEAFDRYVKENKEIPMRWIEEFKELNKDISPNCFSDEACIDEITWTPTYKKTEISVIGQSSKFGSITIERFPEEIALEIGRYYTVEIKKSKNNV